ncbi:MAG TPA: hypothetical protein VEN82_01755 [Actinomycetota bacterium]|nr:hypothetical protein [Actinomycetota bacterium]
MARRASPRAASTVAVACLALAWATPGISALAVSHGAPRPASPQVPKNLNTSRMPGNQDEQTIAVNPTNPKNVVVTSNLDTGSNPLFAGLMESSTFDGGATWTARVIADGSDGLGIACCDSSLAFDDDGNLFLTYLLDTNGNMPVALSTDGGVSFSVIHVIKPATPAGSPGGPVGPFKTAPRGSALAADQPTISAGAGTVWVTYTAFSPTAFSIQSTGARIAGLGHVKGWIKPENVPTRESRGDYGDVAIGPTGQVMVTYQRQTGGQGPANIFVSVDRDGLGPGGFSAPLNVADTNVGGFDYIPAQQERSIDAEANLAWDRDPTSAHLGRAYLVWTSETPDESNDTDIMFQWSDDDGASWSPPVRLNTDSSRNSQFLPAMALDQSTGAVAVSWYDCRNDNGHGATDTDGIANTDAQVFGTYTLNGGTTFAPNFRISQGVSNATASGSFLDYGDYTHATFADHIFYPVWSDNSNSTGDNPDGGLSGLDVYTTKVVIG